ncbi:hypothetical protein NXY55_24930, partial [Aeromonas veronii]|nr:hypothetical protein [Aeromonas veronii]
AKNAAADLIVKTINDAIDASGSNIDHISGWVDSTWNFVAQSGSKGTTSSFATSGSAIGGTFLNAGTPVTGTNNYNGTIVSTGDTFNFEINGVTMQAALTGDIDPAVPTTMADAATQLQTDINTAIGLANTAAGASSSADPGFIADVKVSATEDGRFEIISESGPISFQDLSGKTTVSDLGLSQAQTSASGNGGMTFQIGANSGQTISFGIG